MKKILLISFLFISSLSINAQVAINTDGSNPDPSAMLDIKSTSSGILIPRMSAQYRDAIAQPATGLLVFVTSDSSFYYYSGNAWQRIVIQNKNWINIGDSILYSTPNYKIGIGTSTPGAALEVKGHIWQTGTGSSIFVGEDAGAADDYTKNYNVFVGYNTGKANTSGDYNTALGAFSFLSNTSGDYNTATGTSSLKDNTSGQYNVAIGNNALEHNTQASQLVAIGYKALMNNGTQAGCANTAIHNTAVGNQSLELNAGGTDNTAVGFYALNANNGTANTAFGSKTLEKMATGNSNTAMGAYAFSNATTGSINIAIGISAMQNFSGGNENIGIGYHSLDNNQSGQKNIAIGSYALSANTTGQTNISVGSNLGFNTSGNGNIALGSNNLSNNTDGSFNIAMGDYALANNNSGSYNIALGYNAARGTSNNNHKHNIAIGYNAMNFAGGNQNIAIGNYALSTTGANDHLIAIGDSALLKNTGKSNLAIGFRALSANQSGKDNIAIGEQSLNANDWGKSNTSIGHQALYQSGGDNNVAIGNQAGYSSTQGDSNVFIGHQAGYYETGNNKLYIANSATTTPLIGGNFATAQVDINGTIKITGGNPGAGKVLTSDANGLASWQTVSGASNSINDLTDAKTTSGFSVFLGNNSGASAISSGLGNTGLGEYSLYAITDGDYNTAQGYNSLSSATTGNNNTAIGRNALRSTVSGNNNTAIGYMAGDQATGSGNVFIGYSAGANETGSNKLYIANSGTALPLIGGDFSTSQVAINGSIKITGGNPGAGKVLTSDANGLATWTSRQIDDLSDVDVSTNSPVNGQVLKWNGTNWVPANDNNSTYSAGTGLQLTGNVFSLNSGIDNLTDVNVSTYPPTNGQVLGWNGYFWTAKTVTINDLNDGINDGSSLFMGSNSGANDDGTYNSNLGVGTSALNANTSGNNNSALGAYSLRANTTGNFNTSIGTRALFSNTGGSNNTAIGDDAGHSNTSGSGNIFIGHQAGYNETGSGKLYIANSSTSTPLIGGDFIASRVDINGTIKITGGSPGNGKVLTSDANGLASWQTPATPTMAIDDLSDAKASSFNVFLGQNAGQNNTSTGDANTSLGHSSLAANTSGTMNVAVGYAALASNTTGVNNTAIGTVSAYFVSAGDSNTVLGYMAGVFDSNGNNVVSQYNSLLLGASTRPLSSNDTNEIVIGMGAVGLGNNSVVLGNSDIKKTALYGKVGIGTTSPQSTLEVNGGVKVANDNDVASASKVGTLRYRSDSNNSYVEMCVQTGASTYSWVIIHQETW